MKRIAFCIIPLLGLLLFGCPTEQKSNPPAAEAEILSFVFNDADNAALDEDCPGIKSGLNIAVGVPYGTDVTALVPTISISEGATINPASGTAQDFSSPVAYTVTAEDGTTQNVYTVTVIVAGPPPKEGAEILTFVFAGADNAALDDDCTGIKSGLNIAVGVPYGTDVSALVPTITISEDASITPASGTAQDFSSPVAYTVTAEDGTTQNVYTVTVIVAGPPPKEGAEILTFVFADADNAALDEDCTGIKNGLNIAVGVPYGTDVSALVPTISISEDASIIPASGSAQNFSSPVTYTVTAEDGTTQNTYTVGVIIGDPPLSSEAEILTFIFTDDDNTALDDDYTCTKTGLNISVELPYGTDVSALVPAITISEDASITPASGTAQDFSSPVAYTVTAEDSTTQNTYTVTVTVAPDTIPPGNPTLSATQAGSGHIYLSWEEPVDADYDHLLLTWSPGGSSGVEVFKGTTVYDIAGLKVDATYTVTGQAVDTAGNTSSGDSITLFVPDSPMEVVSISTVAELNAIDTAPENLNDYYLLIADLDLAGMQWDPIGNDPDPDDGVAVDAFTGIFEGNGHTISNLTIDSTLDAYTPDFVGLFEYIGTESDNSALVRNLTLENVEITGDGSNSDFDVVAALSCWNYGTVTNCGVSGTITVAAYGLAGGMVYHNDGTMESCTSGITLELKNYGGGGLICDNDSNVIDCHFTGAIVQAAPFESDTVGGLICRNSGTVDGCSSSGTVAGGSTVGGLIALDTGGTVRNSYSSADVITGGENAGGLIAETFCTTTIENCHTNGSVTGSITVGGLVGKLDGSSSQYSLIIGCHAEGTVSGQNSVGGLVGRCAGIIHNSYTVGSINITGATGCCGGLVGNLLSIGFISFCYTDVLLNIEEGAFIGGLVGLNQGPVYDSFSRGDIILSSTSGVGIGGLVGANHSTGRILRCYSTGYVSDSTILGGLTAVNEGTVADCFYDSETSGYDAAGGASSGWSDAGTPKTTAEMTDVDTFTETDTAGLDNPWDFEGNPNDDTRNNDDWDIDGSNGGYPHLNCFE